MSNNNYWGSLLDFDGFCIKRLIETLFFEKILVMLDKTPDFIFNFKSQVS